MKGSVAPLKMWKGLLSRDWAGLKWRPILKLLEYLQGKHSEEVQNSYTLKPLAINVNLAPRFHYFFS